MEIHHKNENIYMHMLASHFGHVRKKNILKIDPTSTVITKINTNKLHK